MIITTAFKIVKTKMTKKDMYCNIKIKINGIELETIAMIDSGNILKEPITGTPVIVVESTLLEEALPREILNNLEKIIGGDFEGVKEDIKKEYLTRLKLIPYSSLGKQNGMLVGIKTEYIEIENEEQIKKIENVIIGIYNKSLTKKGEYRALVGIELL